jgi:hypothetical protein
MGWRQVAVIAPLVIIESGKPSTGLFIYNGKPGLGNPPVLAAVAPGVTTDPFGNPLPLVGGSPPVLDVGNLAAGGARIGIDQFGDLVAHAAAGAEIWLLPGFPAELIYDSSGSLVDSIGPVAGTDSSGHAFAAGLVSYQPGVPDNYARLISGGLELHQAGSPANPPGVIIPNPTDLELNSGSTGADGAQILVRESAGVLIQTRAGGPPSPLVTINGNTVVGHSNALAASDPALANGVPETPHAFTFANGYTQAAGRSASQYTLIAGASDLQSAVGVTGSVVVPAGGFVLGQALITAAPAAYRPTHTAPLIGLDLTSGAIVRMTWGAGGVLQGNQVMTGAVAAGDTIDIPYQLVQLNN